MSHFSTDFYTLLEDEFGEEKLEAIIRENMSLPSGEIIEKILEAVNDHSRNVPQSDDITIIVINKI